MITINIRKRTLAALASLIILAMIATGCFDNTGAADSATQMNGQNVVNEYSAKFRTDRYYPLDQINFPLEVSQQREKILRFNNPAKIGYVYIFNPGVKEPIGYYTIKGKVSSTNSQITPSDQVYWTCKHNHGCQPVIVHSPSDDGSYGENEPGYFMFTTEDVYVFIPSIMAPVYMDSPINIWRVPQINDPSQKPTSQGETPAEREAFADKMTQYAKDHPVDTTPEEDEGN